MRELLQRENFPELFWSELWKCVNSEEKFYSRDFIHEFEIENVFFTVSGTVVYSWEMVKATGDGLNPEWNDEKKEIKSLYFVEYDDGGIIRFLNKEQLKELL